MEWTAAGWTRTYGHIGPGEGAVGVVGPLEARAAAPVGGHSLIEVVLLACFCCVAAWRQVSWFLRRLRHARGVIV